MGEAGGQDDGKEEAGTCQSTRDKINAASATPTRIPPTQPMMTPAMTTPRKETGAVSVLGESASVALAA